MRKEKKTVQEFYDNFGWYKNTDGTYKDTAKFVDMRPVMRNYSHKMHMRVKDFIKPNGKYFLDAGSGAIPHPEYLEYSSDYERRICVDLSVKALSEARSKLKDRGFYVKADLTKLPFKDGVFDTTVSAHVLYHVPEDEQKDVIFELYRTLKKDAKCVIIYTWKTSLWRIIDLLCVLTNKSKRLILITPVIRFFKRKLMNPSKQVANEDKPDTPNYSKAYDYRWFKKTLPDNWVTDVRCWRFFDKNFSTVFVPNNFVGRFLLAFIFMLENIFPHVLARIGRYPMIIIRKQ